MFNKSLNAIFCMLILIGCSTQGSEGEPEGNTEIGETETIVIGNNQTKTTTEFETTAESEEEEGLLIHDNTDYTGVFKYSYEYVTETLNEDHYIVIEAIEGQLVGRYYGTSDEFDEAREGYHPGYFVLDMQELSVDGNTIEFSLVLGSDMTYTYPIDLRITGHEDVDLVENPHWSNSHMTGEKLYLGLIEKNRLILNTEYGERTFIRE